MSTSPDAAGGTTSSRLVVVAGSGRSGTSSVAGVLKTLGLHIPPPEVPGTKSNPLGHFEPQWVVDFQQRLLRTAGVKLTDARPGAFEQTAQVGLRPKVQQELVGWLREHMATSPELIVKDPRNSWFLPMWREAAQSVGVTPAFLTMLRHPAEVVGSKNTYYYKKESQDRRRIGETSRVASWVNVALFTEHPTRHTPRVFIRYTDLLGDWRSVVGTTAETLDLSLRHGLKPDRAEEVDAFVDPDLHRVKVTWDDLDIPTALRDLAEDVWQQLNRLADSGGQDAKAEAALDGAREAYQQMYDDAFALASSSVNAEVRRAVRQARQQARKKAAAPAQPQKGRAVDRATRTPAQRALERARGTAGRMRGRLRSARGR